MIDLDSVSSSLSDAPVSSYISRLIEIPESPEQSQHSMGQNTSLSSNLAEKMIPLFFVTLKSMVRTKSAHDLVIIFEQDNLVYQLRLKW